MGFHFRMVLWGNVETSTVGQDTAQFSLWEISPCRWHLHCQWWWWRWWKYHSDPTVLQTPDDPHVQENLELTWVDRSWKYPELSRGCPQASPPTTLQPPPRRRLVLGAARSNSCRALRSSPCSSRRWRWARPWTRVAWRNSWVILWFMCIDVYWCVLMCIYVCWCVLMCLDVYLCVLMCIDVYWCVFMCIDVYWCVFMCIDVYLCVFMCIYVCNDVLNHLKM